MKPWINCGLNLSIEGAIPHYFFILIAMSICFYVYLRITMMESNLVKQLLNVSMDPKLMGRFNKNFKNVRLSPMPRLYKNKRLGGFNCANLVKWLGSCGYNPKDCMFVLEDKKSSILVFNKKRTVVISDEGISFLCDPKNTRPTYMAIFDICYHDVKYEIHRKDTKVLSLKALLVQLEEGKSSSHGQHQEVFGTQNYYKFKQGVKQFT